MTRTRRSHVVAVLLSLPAFCGAQTSHGDPSLPDSLRHFGLVFDVQAAPNLSSLSSYSDGGYTISLGFGLNVSPLLQMTIQVYTGRETIPNGSVKPATGWLPVGGASLEATLFFTSGFPVRPYGSAGYGLYTINGDQGYNGGGPHIEAGVEWDFSRYVSIRGGAQYSVIRYHDPTGEAYQSVGFEPFTLRIVGAVIRCAFYPSVLP